jgi:hypothetical protein
LTNTGALLKITEACSNPAQQSQEKFQLIRAEKGLVAAALVQDVMMVHIFKVVG